MRVGPRSCFPGVSWGSVDPETSDMQPGSLAVLSCLLVLWDLTWLPTCLGWAFSIWGCYCLPHWHGSSRKVGTLVGPIYPVPHASPCQCLDVHVD